MGGTMDRAHPDKQDSGGCHSRGSSLMPGGVTGTQVTADPGDLSLFQVTPANPSLASCVL